MNGKIEIILYLPKNNQEKKEPELLWIKGFQEILKVSLEQLISKEITFKQLDNKSDVIKQMSNSVIIQIIQNDNIDFDSLIQKDLKNNQIVDLNFIQIVCCLLKDNGINIEGKKLFNFYEENTGKPVNLNVNEIHKIKDEIWLKFFDIALEIKNKAIISNKPFESKSKQKSVFLAISSPDQNYNRNIIEREINQLGYTVTSPLNFIQNIQDYKLDILNKIENSLLSIHFIGNNYSPLIKDSGISLIEYQNNLFTELINSKNKENLYRLVFIDPELKPKSEKQKQYIDSFTHNIDELKNTEIIQAPIEVFKSVIFRKLNEINPDLQKKEFIKIEKNEGKSIYLIHNDSDKQVAEEIKSFFHSKNYYFLDIENKLSNIDQIRAHKKNLVDCDSLVVLYLNANKQWLISKISDILKSPGIGRKRKFDAKVIYTKEDMHNEFSSYLKNITIIDQKVSIKEDLQAINEILK